MRNECKRWQKGVCYIQHYKILLERVSSDSVKDILHAYLCFDLQHIYAKRKHILTKVSSICLHYLLAAILEDQGGPSTWQLHTTV